MGGGGSRRKPERGRQGLLEAEGRDEEGVT